LLLPVTVIFEFILCYKKDFNISKCILFSFSEGKNRPGG